MDNEIEKSIEIIHTSYDPDIMKRVESGQHQHSFRQIYSVPSPEMILSLTQRYYGTDAVMSGEIVAYLLRKITNLDLQKIADLTGLTPAHIVSNPLILDRWVRDGKNSVRECLTTIIPGLFEGD